MDITFESRSGTQTLETPPDETILFAGLSAGLSLPYECATGTCGMCRARLKSGTIETIWEAAPAHAKLQRERGDFLMCQSRATSPCVVRVPGSIEVRDAAAVGQHACHIAARITHAERLTPDVMHFEVTLAAPMTFLAGQFAVLTAVGVEGGRAYSMVNHEPACTTLEFVIKNKAAGGLSTWAFGGDRVGAALDVYGPLGRAVLHPATDGNVICIAGGSGIAGILSLMEYAVTSGHLSRHTARVFFGVRTLADGFYLDRFADLCARSKGALSVTLALSDVAPEKPTHPTYPAIALAHGFVHEVASAALAGVNGVDFTCFVAGPVPMVNGAIGVLLTAGVPSSRIRFDKFG